MAVFAPQCRKLVLIVAGKVVINLRKVRIGLLASLSQVFERRREEFAELV